jgi:hypothetical protein
MIEADAQGYHLGVREKRGVGRRAEKGRRDIAVRSIRSSRLAQYIDGAVNING